MSRSIAAVQANPRRLHPLSKVSEDNLPNATPGVYVPRNSPAIGNLMTLFDFSHPDFATIHLPTEPMTATQAAALYMSPAS